MLGGTALLLGSVALVGGEPWSAWDTCAKTYARDVSAIFPRHTTDERQSVGLGDDLHHRRFIDDPLFDQDLPDESSAAILSLDIQRFLEGDVSHPCAALISYAHCSL